MARELPREQAIPLSFNFSTCTRLPVILPPWGYNPVIRVATPEVLKITLQSDGAMSISIPNIAPGLQQQSEVRHHQMAATMSKSNSGSDNKGRNWEDLVSSLSRSYNEKVSQALRQHEYNFVLSDPRLPDHPIVYASEGFLKMSGYEQSEVLGRNCRFLQGPETDRRTVGEIRDAVREERPCQVRILNYRKDGKAFWNLFHMAPVFSKTDGRVIHFVGVQTPIASDLAAAPSLMNDLTHEAESLSAKVHEARDDQANSEQPKSEGGARESEEVADQGLQTADNDVNLRIRGGGQSPLLQLVCHSVHVFAETNVDDNGVDISMVVSHSCCCLRIYDLSPSFTNSQGFSW